MKEHPILFNSEMVRAILDGRKTQTRRVIKPQPVYCDKNICNETPFFVWAEKKKLGGTASWIGDVVTKAMVSFCPFGRVGDRLWVRETWRQPEDFEGYDRGTVLYAASEMDAGAKWKPSIHMPRYASRITLEITDIRVERLQKINEDYCKSEGLKVLQGGIKSEFATLWNSINKKHTWESNPYVWVIEFRRVEK